jgi:hypothetical protein
MKNIVLALTFAFLSVGVALAQQQPTIKKTEIKPKVNSNVVVANPSLLMVLPDLLITENIVVFTNPSGARILRMYVKNAGAYKSSPCVLQIKYSWRIDHESFSAREIIHNANVPQLEAGEMKMIEAVIPDGQIRSNEGYGSNNVSIWMKVDIDQQVKEKKEDNNQQLKSVPILR